MNDVVLRELSLFSGCGGGIFGAKLLGWKTVCAVELEASARRMLLARQNDGTLSPFPIWDDIREFDGVPWRGFVDILTGGFPCQDISSAGKGVGISGEKSGLWSEFARVLREIRPPFVLVENSPILTSRGLGTVLGDLAAMGYDARWGVLGAADAIWALGDPCVDHRRDRIWIIGAMPNTNGLWQSQPQRSEQDVRRRTVNLCKEGLAGWWSTEPGMGRVANGISDRSNRIKALGNAQVPAVVALAWEILS